MSESAKFLSTLNLIVCPAAQQSVLLGVQAGNSFSKRKSMGTSREGISDAEPSRVPPALGAPCALSTSHRLASAALARWEVEAGNLACTPTVHVTQAKLLIQGHPPRAGVSARHTYCWRRSCSNLLCAGKLLTSSAEELAYNPQ